ncbi:UNVERIFIED_CONTAM: hypothetical protein Sradi_4777300 [Sesamum radiatum]|uniref:Uncharacterized protein n=1 Tax=Sesamum radiatum TaxID=300843 RepID=A0AAW2MVX8_SESRA
MANWQLQILPGGCTARVKIMNAKAAARAVLLASHPGPNIENAKTPIAAQPICATNMLYFCKSERNSCFNS